MDKHTIKNKFTLINIGGTTYKCYTKTLTAFSTSKLANLDKENDEYDDEKNEYFFDRNPILFAYILDSFRKGAIHLPKDICGTTFRQELEFWEIPPRYVAPCCWEALYGSEGDIEIVHLLLENFRQGQNLSRIHDRKSGLRTRLWLFLDEPKSSRSAFVWNLFISFLILAALLADSLSTIDIFQENHTEEDMMVFAKFADSVHFSNATMEKISAMKPNAYLLFISVMLHAILTLELVIGFVVCPNKNNYFKCISRVIACFGYVAYWISCCIYLNLRYVTSIYVVTIQVIFGYLSILKIFRLFYLSRSIPAFRLITLTFRSCKQEMKILVFLLSICVFVYGYFLFAAEFLHNPNINNVFKAIYWALITLTTVGYGNYVPVTTVGHVIAGSCAVCGVIVIALPVGIIASKFYKYYNYCSYIKTNSITEVNMPQSVNGDQASKISLDENSIFELNDL